MKNLILAFIIGLVSGAVAILLWNSSPAPEPAVVVNHEAEALKNQLADLKKELANSQRPDTQKPAPPKAPSPIVKTFTMGDEKIDMKTIESLIANQMAQHANNRVAAQISTLRTRLGLSPEQEDTIKEILTRKESPAAGASDIGSMALQLVGKANINSDELTDFETEIRAVLNEEQAANYDSLLAEQRTNSIESIANQRLAQLQQNLDLSPEQKDQAFAVFTDSATSSDSAVQEREKLREILTPEQMTVFEFAPKVEIINEIIYEQ